MSQSIELAVKIVITVLQSIEMAVRNTMTVLKSIEKAVRRDILCHRVNRETSGGDKTVSQSIEIA